MMNTTTDLKEPLPLSHVRRFFPGNPSADTLKRWIRHGISGVRLKSQRVGRRFFVTQEAAQEFIAALNPDLAEGSADA